jgi:hypothetical protein
METSPPSSFENKDIKLGNKSRHLVECKTKATYEIAKKALSTHNGLKIEMNNYDGTCDFIIECTPEYAEQLKQQKLSVKSDASFQLRYDSSFYVV